MSYNVLDYSDSELRGLLGFSTIPSDRELEAKIIQQIKNYQSINTSDSLQLAQFFQDVYAHFFDISESKIEDTDETQRGNLITTDIVKKDDAVQLTQTVTYSAGTINPILKETYTRTISIDSQYRDYTYPSSTDFTFNFTETLKDVVSMKLYAVQIPNTWYTISQKFGSNYFFLKPMIPSNQDIIPNYGNYGILGHNYSISIEPGNYTSFTLTNALSQSISNLSSVYTDVSFGSTSISYSSTTCKATLTIDIQKTYNESYYKMFITSLSSTSNLSSILGFGTSYTLWTVSSKIFTVEQNGNLIITNANNRLTLERYIGTISNDHIQTTGNVFQTIYIDLSNGTYKQTESKSEIREHINNQLKKHPQLIDSEVTKKTIIGNGNDITYYWEWKLKLNRFTTIPSDINAKMRLIVPDDPVWKKDGQYFEFLSLTNELNTISSFGNTITTPIRLQEKIQFIPVYDINGGVYIDPKNIDSNNLETIQTANDITIDISGEFSNLSDVITTINTAFSTNMYTYGSYFTLDDTTNAIKLYYNINKVFTTKDYKLVFYDTDSFQKCSSNSSYKNAKIDNTLGWILGFRTMVEYPLESSYKLLVGTVFYYLNIDINTSTGSLYTYQELVNQLKTIRTIITLTGDTVVSVYLFNYLMVLLDDYNQNHLNDGLVTITRRDTSVTLPSYANRTQYQCDPITGEKVYNTTTAVTQNQYYSVQQIIQTQNVNSGARTSGPFIKDMFAILPVKIGEPGTIYTEFGGTLQAQERLYFGPVNINRMSIQLINDKGDPLDLNGANWSLQLICEQLYQRNR